MKKCSVRFTLRSLLLAVGALCVLLMCSGALLRRAHLQQRATEAVEDHGGWILYDYHDEPDVFHQDNNYQLINQGSPIGAGFWGRDFLHEPTALLLKDTQGDSNLVSEVSTLTSLRKLILLNVGVEDLRPLRHLEQLEALIVMRDSIIEGQLPDFRSFPNLKHLVMSGIHAGNPAYQSIGYLDELVLCTLSGPGVDDSTLADLSALKKLRSLCLVDTSTTQQGRDRFSASLPDCFVRVIQTVRPSSE